MVNVDPKNHYFKAELVLPWIDKGVEINLLMLKGDNGNFKLSNGSSELLMHVSN